MQRFGLLGRTLGHSFSPAIHQLLGHEPYDLYPVEPENLPDFLQNTELSGFNITIPYKKSVVPYCAALTRRAELLGNVNTMVRRADGSYLGDNTDYAGFRYLLGDAEPFRGQKALVLGSGGASATVCAVLRDCGIVPVVISRHAEDNYENLERHADAVLLVNATPVGMYPNNGDSPLDLRRLPNCRLVLDLIYNPARTALLLQAEHLQIEGRNGLSMLVAQAVAARNTFFGSVCEDVPDAAAVEPICRRLEQQTQNLVLIGMPGCGKSTVARILHELTGRAVLDTDKMVVERIGMDIPSFFAAYGEAEFRKVETQVLREAGKQSGAILATGGGIVTVPENYDLLHQNGKIVFLQVETSRLSTKNRPVSQREGVENLLRQRLPLYESWSCKTYENQQSPQTAAAIKEDFAL